MNTESVALELERNALRSTLRAVLARAAAVERERDREHDRAVAAEARLAAVKARATFESAALDGSYRRGFNTAMEQIRAALAAPSPQAEPVTEAKTTHADPNLHVAERRRRELARAQAEPATCPHGKTEAHEVIVTGFPVPLHFPCPGPQSTEETNRG